ncbi:hypothetical protein BJV77DRAFT_1064275 [Russula vinacea]|nr:hypothetical protein BJV77DRAFT_1064275 [Russula vinacea]
MSLYRAPSPSPYGAPPRAPSPNPYGQRAPSPNPYGQRAPSPNPYGQRAPSPNPYAPRASSPLPPLPYGHGPPSPIPPTQALQPAPNSAPGSQIQPGTITYTTSTSPDGRSIYHPFKAVPVSYQTANGVVSGIQWVPAEATSVLPAGAQPANSDFVSSWGRGNRDDKALKEWQKDEEHRIRKEEKEAKRIKKERERQARDRANPGSPRMDNVDLNRGREYNRSPYQGQVPMAPPSPNTGATNLGYPPASYPSAPYPSSGHGPDIYRAPSPYRGAGGEPQAILSRSRAPSPNPMAGGGPPGGVYSPRSPSPLPGGMPPYGNRSRAPSPNPGGGPNNQYAQPPLTRSSPNPGAPAALYNGQPASAGGEQPRMLPPPDGFSRPANLAQSYTFFDTMKIQDMDDYYENMPRMPKVLVPHDVYHEDWIRFNQDLALAWAGKLPTIDQNRASRPSVVTGELVDLWNNSFFAMRGVELERNLPGFDSDSDSSGSLSSDSSDLSDDKYGRGAGGGPGYYGGTYPDSKRRKAERKAEKKRKNKEKKARRRAKERERTYAIYISCVAPRDGALGAPY